MKLLAQVPTFIREETHASSLEPGTTSVATSKRSNTNARNATHDDSGVSIGKKRVQACLQLGLYLRICRHHHLFNL